MKAKGLLATRFVIAGMVVILAGLPELARAAQEPAPPATQTPADATTPADQNKTTENVAQEPDSPGATKTQEQQSAPTPSAQSQTTPKKPLGTAAAEPLTPSGTGASEPAGVAIAPAKQRRGHSLLIKVGAIVAAGAALGTVYALSNATGSKPPGSR
jgi:hypothetical protein